MAKYIRKLYLNMFKKKSYYLREGSAHRTISISTQLCKNSF